MRYAARIRDKITAAFPSGAFVLEDQSAHHAGHAGARPGGETHFYLAVTDAAFAGLSRVERQRKIYALLAEELKERVHALSLNLKAPGEN